VVERERGSKGAMCQRRRVNRGVLDFGVEGRQAQIDDLRAFAATLDENLKKKQERNADTMNVDRAVDVFNNVFDEGESTETLRKRVGVLEVQLEQAREVISSAKQMDAEHRKINVDLQCEVEKLRSDNQKLYALAGYLRHFEKENRELRFLLGDFFKKPASAVASQ